MSICADAWLWITPTAQQFDADWHVTACSSEEVFANAGAEACDQEDPFQRRITATSLNDVAYPTAQQLFALVHATPVSLVPPPEEFGVFTMCHGAAAASAGWNSPGLAARAWPQSRINNKRCAIHISKNTRGSLSSAGRTGEG